MSPVDRHSRDGYLRDLREEYRWASKKQKKRLLDEAVKRTQLARKVVVRKLSHPAQLMPAVQTRPRQPRYDAAVRSALAELWELFDYPCGQRLAPLLREQVPRLRLRGEWFCSEEIAGKLMSISAKTIDRLLVSERQRLRLPQYRHSATRRLLLEQIPIKVADDWDRTQIGNLQMDYVFHCGQTTAGSFLSTLSVVDIATNWWEGEVVSDRTQQATRQALDRLRRRFPFRIRELHPDNDSAFLNQLLIQYCEKNQIALSRSRPLKKNDNCWVEQKNWTHVRKLVGYHRLNGELQRRLLQDLYRIWALWRNFFQPVMRLSSKTRRGSKIHRRYDQPATPYRRLLQSGQLSSAATERLARLYDSLSPITLMKQIQQRQTDLWNLVRKSGQTDSPARKLTPRSVTSFLTQRPAVRLPR
jgi:hypothetical protein